MSPSPFKWVLTASNNSLYNLLTQRSCIIRNIHKEIIGADLMNEIQSLARGLRILKIMADADHGIGVTDLAARLGVNKATASRMVHTLMKAGFVEKAADGRRYQLGPALVPLSQVVINRFQINDIAHPFLKRLVEMTGECAHLAIYAQGQVLYINQVESDATLRVNASIGHLAPLHCTALGKVLLAYGDYSIPEHLERRTPTTITDKDQLLHEIHEVRQQKYAIDNEEYDLGVRCIAAPVYDYRKNLIAALGISGPATRIKIEQFDRLAAHVLAICQELSNQLQFTQRG